MVQTSGASIPVCCCAFNRFFFEIHVETGGGCAKGFKADEFLGYAFKPERGAGSGLMDHPGTRIGQGQDLHSLSKEELFRVGFGGKK